MSRAADLRADLPDERKRSKFRLGTNRRMDIALQKELDDVGKKTIADIQISREVKKNQPVDDPVKTFRKLAPEFKPTKPREKRKTEPIFHDDLQDKLARSKSPSRPALPLYNPLDREASQLKMKEVQRSNTFPYNKENTITTEDMKKSHQTCLGFLPYPSGEALKDLHVLMKGKAAVTSEDNVIGAMERANSVPPIEELATDGPARMTPPASQHKPAIVGSLGTTAPATMVMRPQPPSKPMTFIRPMPRIPSAGSTRSESSSFKSVDIHLPDDRVYSQYDEAIASVDDNCEHKTEKSRASSSYTVKSVKDLVEEAKQIASTPVSQSRQSRLESSAHKRKPKQGGKTKPPVKSGKSVKSDNKNKAQKEKEAPQNSGRTVDEIIMSLKDPSKSIKVSEADRKIQEIMEKVIARTKAVLGDIDTELTKELLLTPEADTESVSSKQRDAGTTETIADDADLSTEVVTTAADAESGTPDVMIDLPQDEDDIISEEQRAREESERRRKEEEEEEQRRQEEEEAASEAERRRLREEEEERRLEALNHQQAVEDLQASLFVTNEDIVSLTGKALQIYPKLTSATVSESEDSLLGTWMASGDDNQHQQRKGIHHFCKVRENVQLPDHYKGVWRRYHIPSKFDVLGPVPRTARSQSSKTADEEPKEGSELAADTLTKLSEKLTSEKQTDTVSEVSETEQKQSAAAKRILDEAKRADGRESDSLVAWQQRAQEVFGDVNLEIDGKKLELKSDESYVYWTPAPPKWSVAPSVVKQELFPAYHGAAVIDEGELGAMDAVDEEEEEEEQETDMSGEATEDKLIKDRHLKRTVSSARDLTDLSRSNLEAQRSGTDKKEEPDTTPRAIRGQFSLRDAVFDNSLTDRSSDKYSTLREKLESMMSNVLKTKLGANFMDISDMDFRSGSVVVEFCARVPYNAPPDVIDRVCLLLQDAALAGLLAEAGVDPDTVEMQDESIEVLAAAQAVFKSQGATMSKQKSEVATRVLNRSPGGDWQDGQAALLQERPGSAPGKLHDSDENGLIIYQDYDTIVEEIQGQRQQLRDMKAGKKPVVAVTEDLLIKDTEPEKEQPPAAEQTQTSPPPQTQFMKLLNEQKKDDEPTPAELALQAGRSYVLLPQKKSKRKKFHGDMSRIEEVEKFLAQPANVIQRSSSLPKVDTVFERELRVPPRLKKKHRNSLPDILAFEDYKIRKSYDPSHEENEREWVRGIWNRWFDIVFPPTPDESEWSDDASDRMSDVNEEKPAVASGRRPSATESTLSESVVLGPVVQDEEDEESIILLDKEVDRLTTQIESMEKARPFDLCRRGAILRKLGRIKPALEDLNAAISLEPQMLDAYWHRHMISLLQNKRQKALDDLNFILKHNKAHVGAYRSRAQIFRDSNDVTMAIVNYSQAIKVDPNDYEAFYQRAQMYEQRGEMLLAMEDYATATKINPTKTDALFKHGLHYFNNSNWQSAIDDFSELIKQDSMNPEARLYRGRAFAQLKQWNSALLDYSATIHLDPNNAKAFYYRGCLLRRLHAKKALHDFSVSLLLDDSDDNLLAYLHRGILYNEICKHEDAVPDFEAVLKLDKDNACAHVNLGLIFMIKMENHHRAIKKFSNAIKADPTYVKAYICRAEAFQKVHDIKNALLDITRAIHLRPDLQHLYMYRGQLILKMGNLDLAAFCVKHASELNSGLGQSPTQQAIVQSFLKNYDKAMDALESATRVKPVPPLFMLLGKTQMKARLWDKAVESFEKALDLVEQDVKADMRKKKPWQEKHSWPPEAAEMYYLVGMCQIERRDYLNAHDAFNNAIRVDSKYAQAYYWRGQTRMKLKQSKGIQDFNRALAIDPDLFQAYLSRAAYYGLKKQYSKAILNCNEAIRLQPNSLRGFLYRGALKYHIKAYSLAIRDLTQAISIDSKCSLAYFNRAVCYHDSGNFQKALQDYGIVLLLGDMLVLKVLINRGLLYLDTKDYRNALHDFLMASEVFPKDKTIHHTLGLCYHKLNRLEEAVKSFTTALELDHSFLDALICRGNVYMDFCTSLGRTYARHDYERALHYQPNCLPARVNLAYNLQVEGKFQKAWHQFTMTIAIDPQFKPALEGRAIINLQMSATFAAFLDINASISVGATAELLTNRGVIYQFMKDRVNAMRDYQEAIQLDSTYSLAYFNAANIYFHTRHFKQALEYYSKSLTHNPQDESAFLNRAITRVLMKDTTGAVKDFNRAIELSPYSAHMYFNRGNLFYSLKMYEKAEEDYSKALKLQPDDPLAHKRRADARGKLGRRDEAVEDYRYAIEIQSHGARH